ncbi:hypothetical protein, partial [Hafnia alvei]|uniref:hypothetical protein n=1 Tax=Hafnia alvei TaxID=569 RepID=UPI0024A985CD
ANIRSSNSGGAYYAFLLKSQAFFFSEIRITAMLFSSSPSDVCVVVPGQWWRIIGTSERLTTPNLKKLFNRASFHQKPHN